MHRRQLRAEFVQRQQNALLDDRRQYVHRYQRYHISNCGGCGVTCESTKPQNTEVTSCKAGVCQYNCTGIYKNVGKDTAASSILCVDISSDLRYCGKDVNNTESCASGTVCVNGECVINSCDSGLMLCSVKGNNECIDVNGSDKNNCGKCGLTCESTKPQNTEIDKCASGVCRYKCTGNYKNVGKDTTASSIFCADISSDSKYCGKDVNNTKTCASGTVCVNGECVINSCPSGKTLCSTASGNTCTDIKGIDISNCGGCGLTCDSMKPLNTETDKCASGVCQYKCKSGYRNVGSSYTQTAINCIDPQTNYNYCGKAEGTLVNCAQNPGTACVGGQCAVSCVTGQIDCNGKCIDPMTDAYYCGATAGCASYTDCSKNATDRLCSNGSCVSSCPNGQTACGGNCLDYTALHIASCSNGIIACQTGYANIDNDISNGCEVNTNTDSMHCGSSNTNCTTSLAGSSCANGQCTCPTGTNACAKQCLNFTALQIATCSETAITGCVSGYADIDKSVSNGCEVNTNTDSMHCGSSNTNCTTDHGENYVCVNGACVEFMYQYK